MKFLQTALNNPKTTAAGLASMVTGLVSLGMVYQTWRTTKVLDINILTAGLGLVLAGLQGILGADGQPSGDAPQTAAKAPLSSGTGQGGPTGPPGPPGRL